MIKATHTCIPEAAPILVKENINDCLLFDIETTGLSAGRSYIYLIGCAYYREDAWQLCQWFAENSSEEFAVLEAFLQVAGKCSHLITFNGAMFDLPYLQKKCNAYLLDGLQLVKPMTDIYRALKPYRRWFGMSSLHQTDVERLMGLCRKDPYSGGELIAVYRQYRQTQDSEEKSALLNKLLLHNLEDVQGMLTCINALLYLQPFEKRCHYADGTADDTQCTLRYRLDYPVTMPFSHCEASGSATLDGAFMTLTLPVENGCVRYYHADYKHYVYLPQERQLLPKAMAKSMGALHAKPATHENCFQRIPVTSVLPDNGENAEALCDAYMQWCKSSPKSS